MLQLITNLRDISIIDVREKRRCVTEKLKKITVMKREIWKLVFSGKEKKRKVSVQRGNAAT